MYYRLLTDTVKSIATENMSRLRNENVDNNIGLVQEIDDQMIDDTDDYDTVISDEVIINCIIQVDSYL